MSAADEDRAFEFARRFWDLGNYLVGFAVVQMLTFLYALGKEGLLHKVDDRPGLMYGAMIVSTVISCFLVLMCFLQERRLLRAGKAVTAVVRAARIAAVGRALVLLVICGGGLAGYHVAQLPPEDTVTPGPCAVLNQVPPTPHPPRSGG